MSVRPRARRGPARLLVVAGAVALLGWLPAPALAQEDESPEEQPPVAELPEAEPVEQAPDNVVLTPHGPLGPGDRDLLIRVRYAGLWEVPAGRLAMEKGTTEEIREVGKFIHDEHVELDDAVREVAAELGVELPNEPHASNQIMLDAMSAADGEEFDFLFVQYLREAHGEIYPIIAYLRAGTQNELMREFADTGEVFVSRHMTYLEGTGLVDWNGIKPPPEPLGTQSRFLAIEPAGVHHFWIWLILGVAMVAGTVQMIRTVRPR